LQRNGFGIRLEGAAQNIIRSPFFPPSPFAVNDVDWRGGHFNFDVEAGLPAALRQSGVNQLVARLCFIEKLPWLAG
jgi:hypothetical protein